ncbi:MAG: murein hydrolase activator EnvC family protein [Trueperaceae bacterium]
MEKRSLLFTFYFLLFTFTLSQQPSELQQQLESNIASSQGLLQQREEEITSITAELGATASALEAQIAERDALAGQIDALRDEEAVLLESVATLEVELEATRVKLNELQQQVSELKTRVQELLVSVYQQRTGRYTNALAQADSFHDLQVNNHYLSLLSAQDYDLITQLSQTASELITTQEMQNQQLGELEGQRLSLESKQVDLEVKRVDLETVIANLAATREGQLATQKDLLESQAALEASILDLQSQREAEIARLKVEATRKRELAAQAADTIQRERLEAEAEDADARAENLEAPVAALPKMASGYVSPVANAEVFEPYGGKCRCLSLRANTEGAAVFAVQSGLVLSAERLNVNDGYLVTIQHADGIVTAYSNLQKNIAIQSGNQVEQGDTLGYLGGGVLIPPDVLKIYVRTGRNEFVDPAPVLGF